MKKPSEEEVRQAQEKSRRLVQEIVHMTSPATDPNGSYTGRPVDLRETPQQDADDL